MKKLLIVITGLAGFVAAMAYSAAGHEARDLTLTCGASSAQMVSFPSGTHTINIKVYRDGSVFKQTTDTFTGSSGTVDTTWDAGSGTYTWKVVYSWTDDGGGMKAIENRMTCGQVTTTNTTTNTVTQTVPGPTVTVTVERQLPAPPAETVTVTQTVDRPVAVEHVTTVQHVVTKVKVKHEVKVKYRDRWHTKTVTKYVPQKQCKCASGYRLWHGKCHPIAHGKG